MVNITLILRDNGLWHRWQNAPGSSTWSQWVSLGGQVKADTSPVATRNADGRLEVFVVGTNNQLYHKWQTSPGSNSWSSYGSLGGIVSLIQAFTSTQYTKTV